MDLNKKLNELKKYSSEILITQLNKKIYKLDVNLEYLKTLSQQELQYIHVKLHNALSYKKPFAKIEDIKKVHDILSKLLISHFKIDKLDDKKETFKY